MVIEVQFTRVDQFYNSFVECDKITFIYTNFEKHNAYLRKLIGNCKDLKTFLYARKKVRKENYRKRL